MQEKFVIIDGSSLMYRAFYALPLLTAENGQYTNAAYGFATMLVKLLEDLQPDALAIAFDKGKKTFRNEMFEAYKGTRKATPEELLSQIPLVHELAEAFGVRLVEAAGFEADDVIGTLSAKAAQAGAEVVVVTGDRDALQLIGPKVSVLLTKKGISEMELYDEAAFREKYGLEPRALIDLKGLMGDSSDNIPGVPGVGEKTALKLLHAYGSMEEVFSHVDEITAKKLQERLRENQELALLSKKLATIVRDMPLEYDAAAFSIAPDVRRLKEFCMRYRFKSILGRVDSIFSTEDDFGFGKVVGELAPEYTRIDSEEALSRLIADVRAEGCLYFYPLLTGKAPQVKIGGMMAQCGETVFWVPAGLYGWRDWRALFADETVRKVTHDFKPLYHADLTIARPIFDTMLAAYLLDPAASRYTLEQLMETYLEQFFQPESFEDEESQAAWAVFCVKSLYAPLARRLAEDGLTQLYEETELPLLAVLAAMEKAGIAVDRDKLKTMAEDAGRKIEALLEEIYALAGGAFNVNSPKQLGEVLFERLALPTAKKNRRGYSTDAEVLEKLRDAHPIVNKILEYRLLMKLKSSYLDGLALLIEEETGRVHTSFNQMVTATGRLSSSEPNLQNIPVRTETGRKIREMFVPGAGYDCLLSADYSQIELRVLAHMSQDKNFVEAFTHGQDIHARTASEVFGVPMDLVSGELRSRAKAVNFGIVYGISDYGLARDLGVSRKEAGAYIESYFEKCPGVKRFIDRMVRDAHEKGYVTTLFGRRRRLPEINSKNYMQRSFAERMAMNTPIQGTAADIIKKAMIDAYRALRVAKLRSRMLLQVHDELVLEVVEEERETVARILKDAMQQAVSLDVPLTVDVHAGDTWASAK